MSCKLTEVETERFIDNITSITPGALSGGLSSVVAHPQRNEIFVGGADGIAKVYRVFRETARKIGDDANLVRKMPKMPGRIFSVAISSDASRLAAASTLDGKSEVRVWQYDFTSEITDELKQILAKRVADRNAEEKKKVDEYQNSEIKELVRYSVGRCSCLRDRVCSGELTRGRGRRWQPSTARRGRPAGRDISRRRDRFGQIDCLVTVRCQRLERDADPADRGRGRGGRAAQSTESKN